MKSLAQQACTSPRLACSEQLRLAGGGGVEVRGWRAIEANPVLGQADIRIECRSVGILPTKKIATLSKSRSREVSEKTIN